MRRIRLPIASAVMALALIAALGGASAFPAAQEKGRSIWDGVYTAAQAERGKANFLSGRCGGCHQLDLSGDRGPTLKGDSFLSHWENGPVNSLFTKISETSTRTKNLRIQASLNGVDDGVYNTWPCHRRVISRTDLMHSD